MNRPAALLQAPHYVLGEIETDHREIEGLAERAAELKMVPQAKLWGWGTVRRTKRTLEELAVESGTATLRLAGVAAESVDALVLCSTRFPGGPRTHGQFVERIMSGLGLDRAAYLGVTLNRCTNLLVALETARALVVSGRHRRVLVVTTDLIEDEVERMESFALFSDSAASCLVTAGDSEPADGEPADGLRYEILSTASAQEAAALDWSHEISADLAREANARLLEPVGLTVGDIDGLLHANLFLPLVTMKERQAGFSAKQLYTANVTRVGHCFAADPLVNLVDQEEAGRIREGGHYVLAVSVPGSRVTVLLRRLAR
ncbi:3-oxoacyl-[acyl-carrier-protein] synthase-3 [Kitasatospora sp. MAP12-15]|uniref:3-oxoacyl-ACP synthase n=1 Tax=unclassified Kitasatospora TaxID=2633591 RepID=UPI0024749030|nr:3-oxoacyl-ACP synthase [Kitasatospora sp. MAP12-44]MDH6110341.1 3-oxoacyl-[acyl-carrier-protein] synthase-3 [Kitasatospora sp. MAP12-44]